MNAIFLCESAATLRRVYAPETIAALCAEAEMDDTVYTRAELCADPARFTKVRFIFTTWQMPEMSEEEIRALLPALECVFYAAGSVQGFARPFLHCGVQVYSAWAANAVPVAEYTVAQILLANKGFFSTARLASAGEYAAAQQTAAAYPGNYGAPVGLIGVGMIGRLVAGKLRQYRLRVMAFDPFLPPEQAAALGVQLTDLFALFRECQVVSNHLANNAQTVGMLHYALFSAMRPAATFLNTGRGAQVVEADLVRALTERPDLTAVLDVTHPEPPQPEHPFYALPNCVLTPHIAGSSGEEVHRMAEYMLAEYRAYMAGTPGRYAVTEEMLKTMA